jgi:hypothetical protein
MEGMDMFSTRTRAGLMMATMVLVSLTLFAAASPGPRDVPRLSADVESELPSQANESVVRASSAPDAAVLAVLTTGTVGLWLLRRVRRRREA